MADLSSTYESTMQPAGAGHPLLTALTRFWPGGHAKPVVDPVLGYESAQPWALVDVEEDAYRPPY
ncbi:hypothetical protein ACG02S_18770 [Roseateles sp. DC23W]|uniref:Uncharacterized protein n=1 Tax=Pelomonas dachongensis TaxID=3299029 RepID=A0ABW7ER84_9BURK